MSRSGMHTLLNVTNGKTNHSVLLPNSMMYKLDIPSVSGHLEPHSSFPSLTHAQKGVELRLGERAWERGGW